MTFWYYYQLWFQWDQGEQKRASLEMHGHRRGAAASGGGSHQCEPSWVKPTEPPAVGVHKYPPDVHPRLLFPSSVEYSVSMKPKDTRAHVQGTRPSGLRSSQGADTVRVACTNQNVMVLIYKSSGDFIVCLQLITMAVLTRTKARKAERDRVCYLHPEARDTPYFVMYNL